MENGVFSTLELHAHGFHGSLACRLAVAWVHVNVLAPQTLRTVIGVAASAYKETAPFAGEVFLGRERLWSDDERTKALPSLTDEQCALVSAETCV